MGQIDLNRPLDIFASALTQLTKNKVLAASIYDRISEGGEVLLSIHIGQNWL
jgi:hypothetical protein